MSHTTWSPRSQKQDVPATWAPRPQKHETPTEDSAPRTRFKPFTKDSDKAAQKEQRQAEKAARKEQRQDERAELKQWRKDHPAERQMNAAAVMTLWPNAKAGMAGTHPIRGGRAELFNADAHKGWTATRVIGGAMTLGASAALAGRKNKGSAAINITFGDGHSASHTVKADRLTQANQYVTAFNTLAAQLDEEAGQTPQATPLSADPAPNTPGTQNITESLRQLAELRDAGIITAEEFEAKKSDLLARL